MKKTLFLLQPRLNIFQSGAATTQLRFVKTKLKPAKKKLISDSATSSEKEFESAFVTLAQKEFKKELQQVISSTGDEKADISAAATLFDTMLNTDTFTHTTLMSAVAVAGPRKYLDNRFLPLAPKLVKLLTQTTDPVVLYLAPYLIPYDYKWYQSDQKHQDACNQRLLQQLDSVDDDHARTSLFIHLHQRYLVERKDMERYANQVKYPLLAFVAKLELMFPRDLGKDTTVFDKRVRELLDAVSSPHLRRLYYQNVWTRSKDIAEYAMEYVKSDDVWKLVITKVRDELQSSSETLHCLVKMLLISVFQITPYFSSEEDKKMNPQHTIHQLNDARREALHTMLHLPERVWSSAGFKKTLAEYGVPSSYKKFHHFVTETESIKSDQFPDPAAYEQIDWKQLYPNSAESIPECLRLLASPSWVESSNATRRLSYELFKPDALPLVLQVIPLLIKLLSYEVVLVRLEILELLTNLVTKGAADKQHTKGKPKESWKREVMMSVKAGLPSYLDLLKDTKSPIREQVCKLLACLPQLADQTVPVLFGVMEKDESEEVKAAAMAALSYLVEPRSVTWERYVQHLKNVVKSEQPSSLLVLTADFCSCRLEYPDTKSGIAALVKHLKQESPHFGQQGIIPVLDNGVFRDTIDTLSKFNRQVVIEELIKAYKECSKTQGGYLVLTMLMLEFPNAQWETLKFPLRASQIAVLHTLRDNPQGFGEMMPAVNEMLDYHNLKKRHPGGTLETPWEMLKGWHTCVGDKPPGYIPKSVESTIYYERPYNGFW